VDRDRLGSGRRQVGERTAAALVEKLAPRVRALKVGPGADPETEMGPLVTRQHLDKVRGYIDAGVAEGAKMLVDGRVFDGAADEGFSIVSAKTGKIAVFAFYNHEKDGEGDLVSWIFRCVTPGLTHLKAVIFND
jgi:hypothetical protein